MKFVSGFVDVMVKIAQLFAQMPSFVVRCFFVMHLVFERVLPIDERVKVLPGRMNGEGDSVEFGKLRMHRHRADATVSVPSQSFMDGIGGLAIDGQPVVSSGDVLSLVRANNIFGTGLAVFVEPA